MLCDIFRPPGFSFSSFSVDEQWGKRKEARQLIRKGRGEREKKEEGRGKKKKERDMVQEVKPRRGNEERNKTAILQKS